MAVAAAHSTTLYTLGRGILSIGEWSGETPPGVYTDLGNAPSIEVEVTEETLDHYSSREGLKLKDKKVVLETGYTVTFDLDEVSMNNLKIFLKGTIDGNVIMANTALDQEYAIKFVSNNAAGPNETWEFWRCQISPGGAFSLIGDEWLTLSFSAEGLADTDNHATSPYFNVAFATTTTTA